MPHPPEIGGNAETGVPLRMPFPLTLTETPA